MGNLARPKKRAAFIPGFLAAALAGLVLLAGACGEAPFTLPGSQQSWHIHGLAVSSQPPRALLVGTHAGLIRWQEGGKWEIVGPLDDYMGLSSSSEGGFTLYRSGHPGPGSRKLNPLGFEVSRDGGATWQTVSGAGQFDFHTMAVSPSAAKTVYAYQAAGAVGLYRSQDGGQTWLLLENPAREPIAMAVHPTEPGSVLSATEGGLLVSRRGGEKGSWEYLLKDVPVTAVAYHPRVPQIIYANVYGEGLLHSQDSGRSWQKLGLIISLRETVLHIAIDPADPQVMYAATTEASIYRSVNGGQTWVPILQQGKEVRR